VLNSKLTVAALIAVALAQPAFAAKKAPLAPIPETMEALVTDDQGAVLFTDPNTASVYRVIPGEAPQQILGPADGLYFPNGLGFLDGALYVSDERGVYQVATDGAESELIQVRNLVKVGPKFPFVKVLTPGQLSRMEIGAQANIRWAHNLGATARFRVELSRDGGANWETLANDVKGTSFVWTVTGPYSETATVRVTEAARLTPETRTSAFDATDDIVYVANPIE
jgi:hypothetical protein